MPFMAVSLLTNVNSTIAENISYGGGRARWVEWSGDKVLSQKFGFVQCIGSPYVHCMF
jgi:hypothetical protein